MLNNNFYTITDIKNDLDLTSMTIELNPIHMIYDGHFPENPIVPGICSIQIIKECIEFSFKNKTLIYKYIEQCKYINAINPKDNSIIYVKIKIIEETSENVKVTATISNENMVFVYLKSILSIKQSEK